jgi:hypothetical protein
MTQMSMMEWLAQAADRLEQAGFEPNEVAIVISVRQEMDAKEELRLLGNIWAPSLHHSEFRGWRIIVRDGK